MSKLKALITALVLSTSTAAMAAPSVSFSASANFQVSTQGSPSIRDHRTPVTYQTPNYQSQIWRSLSASLSANSRNQIRLSTPATYSWLKLQATAGVSFIDQITLRFADGTRQVLDVNKNLDTRVPLQLAIQNRSAIVQINVTSSSVRTGTYQLFGYGMGYSEQPPVYQPPHPLPQPIPQPAIRTTFAQNLSFAGTDGRRFITVEAQPSFLRTVRLAAVQSNVFVKQLLVSYTDGTSQVFKAIDTRLRVGQNLDFKLDGGNKQIARFVVYTDADLSPGELSIFGL